MAFRDPRGTTRGPLSRPALFSTPTVVLCLAALTACEPSPTPPPADLMLRNVTVLDVATGDRSAPQDVFVAGDRIAAVMPTGNAPAPEGAEIVEGEGRIVIPGLWDAHVHSAAAADWHFPLLLGHGVTAVRNMHTSFPDALQVVDSIATAVADGILLGPRFLANGPIVDGRPAVQPGSVEVGTPAEAAAAVDSLAEGGADFIKVYDELSPALFLAVAQQARERGIPVDGHLPLGVTPQEAAEAGMRTIEHGTGLILGCSAEAEAVTEARIAQLEAPPLPFPRNMIAFFGLVQRAIDTVEPERCRAAARALAEGGVAVTPTLVNGRSTVAPLEVMEASDADQFLPPELLETWQTQAASPGEQQFMEAMAPAIEAGERAFSVLHEAGVTLLAGTDIGNAYLVPGRTLHQELILMVEHGLSPLEALQTATVNPARVFGMADSLGAVAPGYAADLVLLDADPLQDIRNIGQIAGVVRAGRWLDRGSLDAAVRDALGLDPTP